MKAKLNLPMLIEADDYHDFDMLEDDYSRLTPRVRVKEIGHDPTQGIYIGIMYSGSLKDPANDALYTPEEARLREVNDTFDWSAVTPIRCR